MVFLADAISNAPGTAAFAFDLPGIGGQLFGDLVGITGLGAATADGGGYASVATNLPPSFAGSNLHVILQAFDVTSQSFGTPSTLDFL